MKAYKGFEPQDDGTLKCLTKTYRDGETYEEKSAVLCQRGMHACVGPLDVFRYYPPSTSVYREVEVDDDARRDPDGDSKVASKRLVIGAELSVMGMVQVGLRVLWERIGGIRQEVEAKAEQARTSATGEVTSGDRGTAAASGTQGTAAASGTQGTAAASGYQGTAAASGDQGTAIADGPDSVAVATGHLGMAKGADGTWLGLVERSDWDDDYRIVGRPRWVRVGSKADGIRIKPDTLYGLRGGRVVAVGTDGEVL